MRHLALSACLVGFSADTAYARISKFDEFVDYSDVVREITIATESGGAILSSWEVNFNDGVLRWTERDIFDPATRSIIFEQVAGDMDSFSGRWSILETGSGVTVDFTASFDLGMPLFADDLEPIALAALDATISKLLIGLFGFETKIEIRTGPARVQEPHR